MAEASASEAGKEELAQMNPGAEDGDLFLADDMTCGFLVPSDRWQAALYVRLIQVSIGENFYLPYIDLDTALRTIDDCIADDLDQPVPDDLRGDLPAGLRDRWFPRDAVEDYLHHLCAMGILHSDGAGGFETSDDRVEWLEKRQAIWKEGKKRQRTGVDRSPGRAPQRRRPRLNPVRRSRFRRAASCRGKSGTTIGAAPGRGLSRAADRDRSCESGCLSGKCPPP